MRLPRGAAICVLIVFSLGVSAIWGASSGHEDAVLDGLMIFVWILGGVVWLMFLILVGAAVWSLLYPVWEWARRTGGSESR